MHVCTMEAQVVMVSNSSFFQLKEALCASHMFAHPTIVSLQYYRRLSRRPFCRKPNTPGRPLTTTVASFGSLGFSADPRISIEQAANNLLKDAASLLVYQEVLRIPPAQAFIKVLLALRRGDEAWKLLDAYGDFYKLMATGQFLSWEELILEGILIGEGNPFAEALANVGNPRSQWLRGPPPSLQAAAAADLSSLQRLSVKECTLVDWVADLVRDVQPEWKMAAGSTLSSHDVRKVSSSSIQEKNSNDSNVLKSDGSLSESNSAVNSSKDAASINSFGNCTLASTRETWRRKIRGLLQWSEAVPLLEEYYAQQGIGRTACEQVLQCKGGKLVRDASFNAWKSGGNLSIHKEHREKLSKQFELHVLRSGSSHILVNGPGGCGKTCLVKSVLHWFVQEGTLRVVQMRKSEMKHLQSILDDLAKNWQLRFVLVVDGLSLTDDLAFMHDWPENVMLCGIGRTATSQERISDEVRDVFGTILTLEDLNLQSYLLAVEEMLEYNEALGVRSLQGSWKSQMEQAAVWAEDRNVVTVRTAAQFVRSIL